MRPLLIEAPALACLTLSIAAVLVWAVNIDPSGLGGGALVCGVIAVGGRLGMGAK